MQERFASRNLNATAVEVASLQLFIIGEVGTGDSLTVNAIDALGGTLSLTLGGDDRTYGAVGPVGFYRLEVKLNGLDAAPPQIVELRPGGTRIRVYLGGPEDCFYRIGAALIPFKAREDLTAVVVPAEMDAGSLKEALQELAKNGIIPSKESETRPLKEQAKMILFERSKGGDTTWTVGKLRSAFGPRVRLGFPLAIDSSGGIRQPVTILENTYTVWLTEGVKATDLAKWLQQANATGRFSSDGQGDVVSITFRGFDRDANLTQLEQAILQRLFRTAEPGLLVSSIRATALSGTWPSSSSYWDNQLQVSALPSLRGHHFVQRIREAWDVLAKIDDTEVPPAIGDHGISLASFDSGIINHKEIDRDAEEGRVYAFDVERLMSWGHENYEGGLGEIFHGLGVFGIMSASGVQGSGIVGAAPTLRHIALGPLTGDAKKYARVLRWLAGFDSICEDEADDNDPCWSIVPPWNPDVINFSHEPTWNDPELPQDVDRAFDLLTRCGRSGRGIVLVYAAGDANSPLWQFHPLAADPRTIAVANCSISQTGDVLRADTWNSQNVSAYGEELDLCALGEQSFTVSGLSPMCMEAPCIFSGASAAAPMVSATAALMLSANPELNWQQIKSLLRQSADRSRIPNESFWPDDSWTSDGRNIYYGSGLLDAGTATRLAKKAVPETQVLPSEYICPTPYAPTAPSGPVVDLEQ
jgi:hypothetical protein